MHGSKYLGSVVKIYLYDRAKIFVAMQAVHAKSNFGPKPKGTVSSRPFRAELAR